MSTPARTEMPDDVPHVPWDVFYNRVFAWKQGEHCALIGPTDSGKTSLALRILEKRAYVTILGTKPRDKTLDALVKRGYHRLESWRPELSPKKYPRRILWPDARSIYAAHHQQREFVAALADIYRTGNWCVYGDELWVLIHHLKMEFEIRTYLQQARSNGISLVVSTQRPARVPLEIYDQSQHLFFWRDNDETNLKRISGISWRSSILVRSVIANLERHEVLYIHVPTGLMCRTMAPPPTA